MKPFAHGINFHHFHDNGVHYRQQGSIDAAELEQLIDVVGRERFLPADEWLDRFRAQRLGAGDLCVTFDDNLRCQYDVAFPVLQHLGLTAFWFVYTSVLEGALEKLEIYRKFRSVCFEDVDSFYDAFYAAVEHGPYRRSMEDGMRGFEPDGYMALYPFHSLSDCRFRFVRDCCLGAAAYEVVMEGMLAARGVDIVEFADGLWMVGDHLRELAAVGHVIGLHSHTHPTVLRELPAARQREEYQRNSAKLTELLGARPTTMSHPCNSYDTGTLAILKGLGVELGFRSECSRPADSPLEVPREDHANLMREMRR